MKRVPLNAIARWELPTSTTKPCKLALGDRVKYIGSDFNLKTQYAGTLEVWEISKKDINSYTCLKPNGRVTSWIEFVDLRLVEVA
ncbi:MAG: hypothetical protein LH613_16000 [Chamaesiphon sp.]|nr:hypothetical protein [Chamaesiphon sp.]